MRRIGMIVAISLCLCLGLEVVAASPASADSLNCTQNVYGQGSQGECVTNIQWMVNFLNANRVAEDGVYGPQTKIAVQNYQRTWGGGYPDGVVGPVTWRALCRQTILLAELGDVGMAGPGLNWTLIRAYFVVGCPPIR